MPKTPAAPLPRNENARYLSKRLRKALQAIGESPLTVVEAPMGYGKTWAVKEFFNTSPVKSIWTTAEENSPEKFWPDFCQGLLESVPNAGETSAALKKLGFPHDTVTSNAARKLLRELRPKQKTVLVFDDCHFLPPSFIAFCEKFAQDIPPDLRLVCMTRHEWQGNKALLHLKNVLAHINRGILALTPSEIREYYACCGLSLSMEKAHALHAGTGGWISALYLLQLDFPDSIPAAIDLKAISTLMREQIYERLSAETKELFFVLAPLERATAAQATRLYGNDAAPLLKELASKNVFVAFDPTSHFYTPHSLFRQVLLNIFEDDNKVTPERRRDIYRACGDVFMDAGELASAMNAWHKAGEFEHALTVLEKDMSRNLVTERAGLYVDLFKDCPQKILERHIGASFKYALAAFSAGDFPAFGAQLQWLGQRCAALPPGPEGDRWRGELHVLLALTKFNDLEAMSVHHRAALALLKGTTKTTSLYTPDSPWALGCPSVLFMFYRESGKLGDALRRMRECAPLYNDLTAHHSAGAEWLLEADALYHAGEFAKAKRLSRKAIDAAEEHMQIGNVLAAYFLQMRLALVTGDVNTLFGDGERDGLGEKMRGLIYKNRDFFLLHTADLCEGWLYAALGRSDKIPDWLGFKLSKDSRLYTFAKGFYYIVYGRALLLARDYTTVIEDFSEALEKGVFQQHPLFSVYANLYLAVAFHMTTRGEEAAASLKIALDTALPDALHMPFAENHDLLWPLLPKALSGKRHKKVLSAIEALAGRMNTGREAALRALSGASSGRTNVPGPDKLRHFAAAFNFTRRQTEMLPCILRGLTIEEIASSMAVTSHGVKSLLTKIMRKAGVARRRQLLALFADWKMP